MNKFQSMQGNSILSFFLFLLGVHNPILTDDTAKCVGRTRNCVTEERSTAQTPSTNREEEGENITNGLSKT